MNIHPMNNNQTIDFSKVPGWWAICGKADCKMAQICLRQRAFESLPEDVMAWRCLMSKATVPVEADGRCRFFAKNEMVKLANGFDTMMSKVNSRDGRYGIRMDLTHYFGSKGSYYRSKHGERQLNPADQQKVLSVFAQYGFSGDDFKFDHYEDGYEFDFVG